MYCPNCKKEIADGLSFCPECGAQLGASVAPVKKKKPITKKWWFWVIIVVVVLALISAVAGGGKDEQTDNNTPVVNAPAENDKPAGNDDKQDAETTTKAQEVVLYNENDIKITYVEKTSNYLSTDFKLLIENDSSKNITVSVENLTVNGFTVNTFFYAQVASGKKANEKLEVLNTYLENNDIDKIETLELSFHIINSDTFSVIDDSDAVTLAF